MPRYRTPLPGILAAMLETAINRTIALDISAPRRLQRLDGRMLQLTIEGLGITLYFAFNGNHVEVGTQSADEPDTVISGSPAALFSMAVPEGAGYWGSDESRVTITGDANLARDLERLFSQLDPDWEGSLSRIFGDVLGHQIAAGLRAGADQARQSARSTGEMLEEFMEREGGPVIRESEFHRFADRLSELEESVEKLDRSLARHEKTVKDGR
jgi:ubiquinone biosynthesis protein UbiJ